MLFRTAARAGRRKRCARGRVCGATWLTRTDRLVMASSPPLLDFNALTAPVPGDNPAGGSIPFDVREQLEQDRREDNPGDYAADDPMRPDQFKKADWPHIIRTCQETLTQSSKDMLLAARMT